MSTPKIKKMERIIAYVDGFNLYFGIRDKRWRRYYWLDIQRLAKHLLKSHQTLECTKYFTSRVMDNPEKQKRQNSFLEALETLTDFEMFFGKYIVNRMRCSKCNFISFIPNEKMTDVNIATEMLADAFQDRFDTALLIGADSDLKGPLVAIRNLFPAKRIIVAFPPERRSWDLRNIAHGYISIGEHELRNSQFPDELIKPDGYVLKRPEEWR